jgi:hypothetical protein
MLRITDFAVRPRSIVLILASNPESTLCQLQSQPGVNINFLVITQQAESKNPSNRSGLNDHVRTVTEGKPIILHWLLSHFIPTLHKSTIIRSTTAGSLYGHVCRITSREKLELIRRTAAATTLRGMQHEPLQKVKVGAAIHLTLDRFETINLALDRAITPPILEGGRDRRILLAQADSKAAQFWDAIPFRPG